MVRVRSSALHFPCKSHEMLRTLYARCGEVAAVGSPMTIHSINRLADAPSPVRAAVKRATKVVTSMEQYTQIIAGVYCSIYCRVATVAVTNRRR